MKTVYLIVPGINNSSPQHWQSLWEAQFPDQFRRVEQSNWDTPICADWIETIEAEVQKESPENVILVAHSLGCIAIAQWAKRFGTRIKGAFLAAPCDCEAGSFTFETKGFTPIPLEKLPFKSLVAASTNDEYISLERAEQFAAAWGSGLVNVGAKGHLNAGAGFGEWDEGLEILKKLD
ncbi:MAG: alpha/beta hydrolase [Acidobacteriota bacterium]|nr:alpha/beta hydrolase [Acidobacteriota bacterium]